MYRSGVYRHTGADLGESRLSVRIIGWVQISGRQLIQNGGMGEDTSPCLSQILQSFRCMKYFHLLESIIACFKDMRLDEAASETTGHKLFVGLNWNSYLKYPLKWNYDGNLLAYMYGNENQICSCSTFRLSIRKYIDDFIPSLIS